jgi:uncharacterized phosphosugar-binding protein
MTAPVSYISAVRAVLDHLETTQLDAVERAADLVIGSLREGGVVYCAAIGHSNEADFINRAGGLASVQPFSFSFSTNDPVPDCHRSRPRDEAFERDLESIRFAVRASNLRRGDVMFVGSVSGKNRYPVELALSCRAIGVRVVGFTSLEYTSHVESLHPSGKKLCDVADVVVDNGAPYGDAAVRVPGYDIDLLPVSGVSMVVIGWMVWGRAMEKMAAQGAPASVFMSVNREGGKEFYDQSRKQYNERGY